MYLMCSVKCTQKQSIFGLLMDDSVLIANIYNAKSGFKFKDQ